MVVASLSEKFVSILYQLLICYSVFKKNLLQCVAFEFIFLKLAKFNSLRLSAQCMKIKK